MLGEIKNFAEYLTKGEGLGPWVALPLVCLWLLATLVQKLLPWMLTRKDLRDKRQVDSYLEMESRLRKKDEEILRLSIKVAEAEARADIERASRVPPMEDVTSPALTTKRQ